MDRAGQLVVTFQRACGTLGRRVSRASDGGGEQRDFARVCEWVDRRCVTVVFGAYPVPPNSNLFGGTKYFPPLPTPPKKVLTWRPRLEKKRTRASLTCGYGTPCWGV